LWKKGERGPISEKPILIAWMKILDSNPCVGEKGLNASFFYILNESIRQQLSVG